nr:hypothetical protein [Tanacetum cinerariifolium]
MPEDPYAYVVAAFQAPPSPDYVPGPEHPPLPVYVPEFVPELVYPKFMPTEDDILPAEEEPLPTAASPTTESPGYVADSNPDEDLEEDPEDDHADYPADGGDGDDEPSDDNDDDDDTDDENEKPFEDEEDDEDEEHMALADSFVIRLHRARKTIILEPPMSASIKACIARHAALLSLPLPISSPPLPLSSPLTTSPTNTREPLGYRAVRIRMRALLPSTSHRTDILKADVSRWKWDCLTT